MGRYIESPFHDHADIAKAFKLAGTVKAFAFIWDVSPPTARRWLREAGIEIPRGGNHNPTGVGGTGSKRKIPLHCWPDALPEHKFTR